MSGSGSATDARRAGIAAATGLGQRAGHAGIAIPTARRVAGAVGADPVVTTVAAVTDMQTVAEKTGFAGRTARAALAAAEIIPADLAVAIRHADALLVLTRVLSGADGAGAAAATVGIGVTVLAIPIRITTGRTEVADAIVTDAAGGAGRIAETGAAVDPLLAIVRDDAARAGTRLGFGCRLAVRAVLSVAAFSVLVALLAPLASPLGITIIVINEGEQPAQNGQGGEQAQQPATGASLGQGAGETVKAVCVHRGPFQRSVSVSSADGSRVAPRTA